MFQATRRLQEALSTSSLDDVDRGGLCDRVRAVAEARAALDAFEARLCRAINHLDDRGVDGAGVLRSVGRVSARSAANTSKLAESLAEMPLTSAALADGKITAEHAATLSRAAAKVSPERADAELVARATACPADVFANDTRKWMAENVAIEDGTDELNRQRTMRTAVWFTDDDGLHCVLAKFDPITGKQLEKRIQQRYEELLCDDRSGDGDPSQVRTHDQRMADAIAAVLELPTAGITIRPHPKVQLLVTADISRLSLEAPVGAAELVGHGAIPQPVLERLACESEMTAVLFNGPGRPIWVGRTHRSATIAQWKALIARDRGCIGCAAEPSRCEAHHIIAWQDLGATDITNLVLVCSRCHHDIHDRGAVLHKTKHGKYRIDYRAGPLTLAA